MPIEAKEVIEFLGFKPEEIESAEVLREKFDSTFTRKDKVDPETKKKILQTAFGSVQDSFLKGLKGVGIELAEEEVKEKRLEEVVGLGISKFKEEKAKFEAFQKNTDPSKEVKEWENKYTTLQKQFEDVNGKYTGLASDYENFKVTKEAEVKDFKLKSKIKDIYATKVDFADGTPELTKEGYFSVLNKQYSPDYDEASDRVYAIDNSTGKRIPGKTAGTDKLYEEVLPEVGIKAGIWKINNHSRNQIREVPRAEIELPPVNPNRRQPAPRIV